MKFGVGLPNYGSPNISFDAIRRVATAAEQLGYDSVWTTDHIIVPKENIDPYGRIFESLITLATVAPITQRVRLGTSVLVLPQRNPVLAAKQIATLDALSGGRMIVGLGVGWNRKEYGHLNADFGRRGKALDEAIPLLRALWSNEEVSFHGQFTHIDEGMSAPLPAQKGNLPIWIGGNNEPSWKRAATLGDGWHVTGASPAQVAEGIKQIRALGPARPLTFSGRLSIDMNPAVPPTYEYRGALRRRLTGADDDIRETLREYAQAGMTYAALFFPMDDISVTLKQMERFAKDIAKEFEE